jgi:hypothetical protein
MPNGFFHKPPMANPERCLISLEVYLSSKGIPFLTEDLEIRICSGEVITGRLQESWNQGRSITEKSSVSGLRIERTFSSWVIRGDADEIIAIRETTIGNHS